MSIFRVFIVLGLITNNVLFAAPAPAKVPKKEKVVFTLKVTKTAISDDFIYPAEILPEVVSDTLADFDGVVASITSEVGREVKKGEEILRLRHLDPLFQNKTLSYRANFNGVVSEIPVSIGSQVGRGTKLFNVIDPIKKKIHIQLTEGDMRNLKVGDGAEVEFIGKNEKFALSVIGISPKLDPLTGTALCILKAKPGVTLPPGNLAKVYFKTNIREGHVVPEHALSYIGRGLFLRVVVGGKMVLKPVKIGKKDGGSVEIIEGINLGDEVIERSSSFIAEGEVVTVKNKG